MLAILTVCWDNRISLFLCAGSSIWREIRASTRDWWESSDWMREAMFDRQSTIDDEGPAGHCSHACQWPALTRPPVWLMQQAVVAIDLCQSPLLHFVTKQRARVPPSSFSHIASRANLRNRNWKNWPWLPVGSVCNSRLSSVISDVSVNSWHRTDRDTLSRDQYPMHAPVSKCWSVIEW